VRHAPLVFGELGGFGFEAVEWLEVRIIGDGGKTRYAKVDADASATLSTSAGSSLGCGQFHFPLGLDTDKPFTVLAGNRDIAQFTQHIPAVAVAYPAQFWQEKSAITLIELDLFGVGITETVTAAFALEAGEIGAL
jgi:hypothetical protein